MRDRNAEPTEWDLEVLLALLDALPASVAIWDAQVRLRYGNRRALSRFGRNESELLGARLADLVHPDAVELSWRYIAGALAGAAQQVERAKVDSNGNRRNAHQVVHTPIVVGGKVTGYSALAVDITATVQSLARARRERERDAVLLERRRIASGFDRRPLVELEATLERLSTAIEQASDALPSLRGASEAIDSTIEGLRLAASGHLLGDPERRVNAGAAMVAAAPPPVPPERDAAREFPTAVPFPQTLTGTDWVPADVVALLDQLPAIITLWDPGFHCLFANRAAVEWFGRSRRADVVGRSAPMLWGSEFQLGQRKHQLAAVDGQAQRFDCAIDRAGDLRQLQVCYTPLAFGSFTGVVCLAADVTDWVAAELELEEFRVEAAVLRERERIADDVHSQVIQRLFVAGLAASRADSSAPQVSEPQLQAVRDNIAAALGDFHAAVDAIETDRSLSDLLPDLAATVDRRADAAGAARTIESVGTPSRLAQRLADEVLRVADVALANALAADGVSSVAVTLAADGDEIWLRVADDGPPRAEYALDAALGEIAAQARRRGGALSWRAGRPHGSVLDWRIPL
jgi:PAS domain S-box-containing protein